MRAVSLWGYRSGSVCLQDVGDVDIMLSEVDRSGVDRIQDIGDDDVIVSEVDRSGFDRIHAPPRRHRTSCCFSQRNDDVAVHKDWGVVGVLCRV